MEVTILVQATDESFVILEEARERSRDVLDIAARLTSESQSVQRKRVEAIFKGARQTYFISASEFFVAVWFRMQRMIFFLPIQEQEICV